MSGKMQEKIQLVRRFLKKIGQSKRSYVPANMIQGDLRIDRRFFTTEVV